MENKTYTEKEDLRLKHSIYETFRDVYLGEPTPENMGQALGAMMDTARANMDVLKFGRDVIERFRDFNLDRAKKERNSLWKRVFLMESGVWGNLLTEKSESRTE